MAYKYSRPWIIQSKNHSLLNYIEADLYTRFRFFRLIISQVGENVERFKIGDHVGVGCLVETCLNCAACKDEEEQLCESMNFLFQKFL